MSKFISFGYKQKQMVDQSDGKKNKYAFFVISITEK